jgi:short-subunit dehydrogenase
MPTAIVTGASAGLGTEFARQLAARGYHLMLVARRLDRLETLREELEHKFGVTVRTVACDLSDTAATEKLAAAIEAVAPPDLLVNNAGFGTVGRFHEVEYPSQVKMVNVHILATMRLTRAVLGPMIACNSGAIINVASVAGFWRSSQSALYCSTKGWINDFTEALALELRLQKSNVKVQALCPGYTITEFHDVTGTDRRTIPSGLWMKAEYVVGESLRGLEKGRVFVIPNWKYRLGAALGELLPTRLRMVLEARSPQKRKL